MPKQNRIKTQVKLFCLALIVVTAGGNLTSATGKSMPFDITNLDSTPTNEALIAKKSGGRSGGGSFKRKSSSPSKRSTPSRRNNQRQSPPSYRREPSRTYRESSPVPIYQNRSNYRRSHNRGGISIFSLMIFLLITGVIIYLLYRMFNQVFGGSRTATKITQERDNDRVTVSILQVVLSAATDIQQDLSELSTDTETDTESGLINLMQESTLALLRHESAWTHVLSRSISLNINQAESAFDRLSMEERSKFSGETLSNIDGILRTRTAKNSPTNDDFANYIVVTLILGTADDKPLFSKINTEDVLKAELLQLSAMREDYLMKFELLWTPQAAGEYLTDEELLLEYTNIIPLV